MRFQFGFVAATALMIGIFAACGSDEKESTGGGGAGTGTVAFTDVAPIVKAKCATAGCHDGTFSPSYKDVTEANFKKSNALARVKAQTMPPSNGTALTATENTTIIGFFGE